MVKHVLLIVALVLIHTGCEGKVEEEVGWHKPVDLTPELRQELDRSKREFLQLEDIKIGDGPLAAWGRKISADIEVRYADGTLV